MHAFLLDLLALLWPTQCVVCGTPDRDCCEACLAELTESATVIETTLPIDGTDRAPVPLYAACWYSGVARALVVGLKHEGRVGFARPLGAALAGPLYAACAASAGSPFGVPPALVAAPSRIERVRERGYRHVELLVNAAGRAGRSAARGRSSAPPPWRGDLIRALRSAPGRVGQVGLDHGAREANAARLRIRRAAAGRLRGREVILVDDIVTSGATATAACRALAAAGAHVVAVASVCLVQRRDGARDPVTGAR